MLIPKDDQSHLAVVRLLACEGVHCHESQLDLQPATPCVPAARHSWSCHASYFFAKLKLRYHDIEHVLHLPFAAVRKTAIFIRLHPCIVKLNGAMQKMKYTADYFSACRGRDA